MENKVIGITAANIVAETGTVSTTGVFLAPQVNVSVPVTEVSTPEQNFTDIQANVLDNTLSTTVQGPGSILTKTSDIQVNVVLSGYGEESISNYGALFLRPSQWLNIATASEEALKGYSKPVIEGIYSQEVNTKLIQTKTNFVVSAQETVIKSASFLRTFFDGGASSWYYSENYADSDIEYVKPKNLLLLSEQKYVNLTKPFVDLSTSAEVNTKLISPRKLELVTGSESASKLYSKQVLEVLTASDDFYGTANLDDDQYAFIIKVLVDDAVLSQKFSSVINTVYADIAVVAESARKTVASLKLETSILSDVAITTTQFRPVFAETVVASDDFLGAANLDDDQYVVFEKVIFNQTFASEQKRVLLSKILNTQLVQSGELHASLLHKRFNDLVSSTDDFYGAANVDDDQYALIGKAVRETTTTSETHQYLVDFKRTFVDVPVGIESARKVLQKVAGTDYLYNISDSTGLHPNKVTIEDSFFSERYVREDFAEDDRPISNDSAPLFELQHTELDLTSISTSLFKFSNSKVLVDSASIFNEYRNALITPKFDLANVSDSRDILLAKLFLETVINIELVVLDADKLLLDQVALSEIKSFDLEKTLESLVNSTDDFYGAANIDDDQYAVVIKVLHDTISVTDFFDARYTPSTPVNDASLITDEYITSFIKVREDSFVSTEQKTAFIEKTTPEQILVTEQQVFVGSKVLIDAADWFAYDYLDETYTLGGVVLYEELGKHLETVVTADSLTGVYETDPVFYAYKGLESQSTLLEVLSFDLSFHLADFLIATDDFYGLANIDDDQIASFNKVLHETPNITSDLVVYTTSKVLNSSISSLAQEIAKDLSKVFADIAFTTDDFYGLANLDDDQVASVGKVLNTSLLGTTDLASFVTNTFRLFYDTSNIGQEVKSFIVAKDFGYSEAVATEQQAFDAIKITSDAFTPVEESAKDFVKVFTDDNGYVVAEYSESIYAVIGPAILDQLVLEIQPSVLENIGLTETYLDFVSEITKLDIPLATEIASKELLFNLLDNFNVTDDFYGEANFDDDQTASFYKVANELVLPAQELVVFDSEKTLLDIPQLLESHSVDLETLRFDNYTLQEETKFENTKVFSDSLVASDILELLLVQGRSFFDNISSLEINSKLISKVADYETFGITETDFTKLLEKSVLNTVIAGTEELFTNISTVLEDKPEWFSYDYTDESYTLGGAVTYDENYFDVSTVLATQTTAVYTNAPVFDATKTLLSTSIASDTFTRAVTYNTSYLDTVVPTDDFLGAANLDDDQYVLFVKAVAETSNTSEAKYFDTLKSSNDTSSILLEAQLDIKKPFVETTSIIEQKTLGILKAINDTLVSTELLTFLLVQGRWFTDTANTSQEFKLGLQKPKLEQITAQELHVVVYDKFNPETIASSQEVTQNYGMSVIGPDFFLEVYSGGYTKGGAATAEYAYKLLDKPIVTPELVVLSDTPSRLLQKYKPEQTTVTETLFKTTLQKSRLELATVAELVQQVIAKAKTEAVASTESATALIENYFPPQFAQAGYVGTNFTL